MPASRSIVKTPIRVLFDGSFIRHRFHRINHARRREIAE